MPKRFVLGVVLLISIGMVAACDRDHAPDGHLLYVFHEVDSRWIGDPARLLPVWAITSVDLQTSRTVAEVTLTLDGVPREIQEVRLLGSDAVVTNDGDVLDVYERSGSTFTRRIVYTAPPGASLLGLALHPAGDVAIATVAYAGCTEGRTCRVVAVSVSLPPSPLEPPRLLELKTIAFEDVPVPELWISDDRVLTRLMGRGDDAAPERHVLDLASGELARLPADGLVLWGGARYADQPLGRTDACYRNSRGVLIRDSTSGAIVMSLRDQPNLLYAWQWSPAGDSLLAQRFEFAESSFDCSDGPIDWIVIDANAEGDRQIEPAAPADVWTSWYGDQAITFRCNGTAVIGRELPDGRMLAPDCQHPSGGSAPVPVEFGGREVFSGSNVTTWSPRQRE